MSSIVLSNGTEIDAEDVERIEYYPKDSFAQFGCHFGGAEMRVCPFLSVQLTSRRLHIVGENAEHDAEILERAGLKLIRFKA